ncbi:MAG: asparagine synthase C-terminal domain-containing protein [Candidatus Woesearchaeota archaeon]
MEIYESSNGLISRDEWEKQIISLFKSRRADIKEEVNEEALSKIISRAVEKRIPSEKCGVLLSGGVDSTLIAFLLKRLGAEVECFSVGISGSDDLNWARIAAASLNLPIFCEEFSDESLESAFRTVKRILETDNPVSICIGAVSYLGMKLASDHNVHIIFSGLGSEELFAGYERHLNALKQGRDVNEECLSGLISMYERDIERDYKISKALGCVLKTPFLDDELIPASAAIPGSEKINLEDKKIILRRSAMLLGLPEQFCTRKKRAAQYGSGFERRMEKIAKKHGFKSEREYCKFL